MNSRENSNCFVKDGWLYKRSNRIASKRQKWRREYVSLRGTTLRFMKSTAAAPTSAATNIGDIKKSYQLSQNCTVSKIYIREKKIIDGIEVNPTSNTSIASATTFESVGEEDSSSKKTLFCVNISWLGSSGKVYGDADGCYNFLLSDRTEELENVPEIESTLDADTQLPKVITTTETTSMRRSGFHTKKKQRQPRASPHVYAPTHLTLDNNLSRDDDSIGNHSESDSSSVTDVNLNAIGDIVTPDDTKNLGGIGKHYSQYVIQEQKEMKAKGETKIRLMYLQKEEAKRRKYLKRVSKGGTYAAAVSATAALSVLTAGISVAVGLVIVGVTAAVGGTSAAAEMGYRKKKGSKTVVLAAATLPEATEWKRALEGAINHSRSMAQYTKNAHQYVNQYVDFLNDEGKIDDAIGGADFRSKTEYSEPTARWEPIEGGLQSLLGFGSSGLRIYREEPDDTSTSNNHSYLPRFLFKDERSSVPLLKSQIIFNTSPLYAFMCLMSYGNTTGSTNFPNSGQRASFRILETVDENSDIIHLFFRPTYIFPFWMKARDFVLFRHWRYDSDKTYCVVYHSVPHKDCPPLPTHIRGKMDAIYSIAPEKQATTGKPRCLLTQLVQVDPMGWIPYVRIPLSRYRFYNEVFAVSTMSVSLDVRDCLDFDSFVSVSLSSKSCAWESGLKLKYARSVLPTEIGTGKPSVPLELVEEYSVLSNFSSTEIGSSIRTYEAGNIPVTNDYSIEDQFNNYDFRYSRECKRDQSDTYNAEDLVIKSISHTPEPCNREKWAEPDANSFRVRGKNYLTDLNKINAGNSLFRLLAVDIYKVEKQLLTGVCLHPDGRMQMALASEKEAKAKGIKSSLPPFVFTMNISLRGPPSYNLVFYFAVDDMTLIDGTSDIPSSKLSKEFFFGDSDEFRDKTFKMIPQIVEGNFVVRKAARSTPVILGTKLKQYYCRSDRFCEVTIDMGSSSVANGAIRLCHNFSKSIVVDLAFLLESNDKMMLPEKILGCVRLKNVSFQDDAKVLQAIVS